MLPYLAPFLVTVSACLALIITQRWHGHLSLDSEFGVQKLHTAPTLRIGGIAIASGLLIAYWTASTSSRELLGPMILAAIPAFAAGLMEDITKNVGVRTRLLATMCSGLLAWALTGTVMQKTGLWGLDYLLTSVPIAIVFTAFVVGGVANAINIIDGFNGLAAGVVTIILAAIGIMAYQVADIELARIAFLMASLSLGFGVLNWPWGKIFMGDGGAYLLGFLVAWLAVLLPMRNEGINGWATLLASAYPVLEVLFSIRRRMKRHGHHPGQPDNCHLHHFVYRRVVRKIFPAANRTLQNGLTGTMIWLLAGPPALWAIAFSNNTSALILGFLLASFGYAALYARLTQFVWCFQAATMRNRTAATA